MGLTESQPMAEGPAGEQTDEEKGAEGDAARSDSDRQFVLIATAPPGVGKEALMGTFISENAGRIGYCAKVGAVRAREPGLLYFYATTSNPAAPANEPHTFPTILDAMKAVLRDGKSVVVDADVAGVTALRAAGVPGTYVFILPASMQALRADIEAFYRGRENAEAEVEQVISFTEREIVSSDEPGLYDHVFQNTDNEKALGELAHCLKPGSVADKVLQVESMSESQPPDAALQAAQDTKAQPQGSRSLLASHSTPAPAAAPLTQQASMQSVDSAHAVDPPPQMSPLAPVEGMERWRGAVAIVTGASSGIGWAVCEALATAGMRVAAAARRKKRLEALQQRVLASGVGGRMFLPVMCDVTKEPEVRTLVALATKTFEGRPVSVLVNCAGVGRTNASLMDGDSNAWIDMLGTNVLAVAMCCREACRNMRANGRWGHIINIGSLSGHRLPQGIGAGGFYAATKHALRALTEGLRQEARADGVPLRVSLLSPGVVSTEFFESMYGDADAPEVKKHTQAPSLTASDVAATVLYTLAAPLHMEVNDVMMRPTKQVV